MPLMDFFEPPERRVRIEDQWKDLDLDTEYLRDPTKRHVMKVSERDCVRHGVVQGMRDLCTHICIPLDKCRMLTFHAPWRCKELQIAYTRCMNNEFSVNHQNFISHHDMYIFMVYLYKIYAVRIE